MTNTNNLPETLKQRGLFCLWKYEERDGRQTKMPYNPNSPQDRAKSNDRSTFAPMATAQARAAGFDGIGIGIFDDIAGIDIDHCIDDAGKLSPMAQDIVQTMDAYTEISPSGKGLRILFLAPGFSYDKERYYIKESKQGLEIYIAGMTNRYLTVTGNTLRSCDLVNRDAELQTVLDRYMKRNTAEQQPQGQQTLDSWQYVRMQQRTAADLTDRELIDRAMNAGNGSAFTSLWNGDISGYPSHSEADQALCNLLAFWTNKDAARMDSLFRQSGLMRDKWNRRQSGTTYGAITISKAIAGCAEGYTPPQEATASPQANGTPAPGQTTPADEKAPQNGAEQPKTAAQLFDSFLEKVQTDIYKPLQTGMPAFDSMLGGGILRQSLVILSAAPGTGKTTLAQQIFETMATTGADVVFLNLEMSREQLLARSLSRMIHRKGHSMNAADVLKGYKWTDAQRGFVMEAADEYRSRIAPHFVYNPQGMGCTYQSIGTVLAKYGDAMKAQGRRAPVVVLDYLLSLNYKALALNETKPGTDKKYRANDPNDMEMLQQQDPRKMIVQVLKNRMNAAGGKLFLAFDSAHSIFYPMERQDYKAADFYNGDDIETI